MIKTFSDCLQSRSLEYHAILENQEFIKNVEMLYQAILSTLQHGGKIMLCGNGGSAADCQHIASEFVGRLKVERAAWPAISLCTDVSILTCLGNDYSYEEIFKRQIEAFGTSKDLLVALSTSGNSRNICVAIKTAKENGINTYLVTNCYGGSIAQNSDFSLKIPSEDTQIVQEITVMLFHMICEQLELNMCDE